MKLLESLLARRRLIVAVTLLLALTGFAAWNTMPREEDPDFPERDALIVTHFPGADAETVERLVIEPIEEHLVEVEEIRDIHSTARAGVAVVRAELADEVYATDAAWDEAEEALERARADFPAGVSEPSLDHDLIAQDSVVLAITGSLDPLVLAEAAERAKRRLLALESVRKVRLVADPGEQITIEYDDATARRLGIDPRRLGAQLAQRSQIVPGGLIHLGSKTTTLRPATEFRSLEEIEKTSLVLPSGSALPLGEIARVRRGPLEPAAERMRFEGEIAVGLGIVPKSDIDLVRFGERVRERLGEIRAELAPLEVEEVFFQPDQVRSRLDGLSRSLLFGIAIVAAVLLVAMGPRLGFVVALVVPLVIFGSIAIFAAGGGVLHQISIAAVVIALGMLVDNAIVVAEAIQWRVDRGEAVGEAAAASVRELALPLASATGTTLAVFVPMLISSGGTADFTRSIPVLILLTLSLSYFFAVLVTPVLSELFLRPRSNVVSDVHPWARRTAHVAVHRTGWVLFGAVVLVALAAWGMGFVEQRFFPSADREIVVVDLEMPEGTHLERTDTASGVVERALAGHPEVVSVVSFMGRNAPHFYYNLQQRLNSPHRAQIIAKTRSLEAVEGVRAWVRGEVQRRLPEAEVVVRRLEQGPPIDAPVELRFYGDDYEKLETAADLLLAELRQIPGTRDVHHDLSLGVPTLTFEIDDAAAGRHGLSRADVALALSGRTLGLEIGQFRAGEDPVPILVRSSDGEESTAEALTTADVAVPGGKSVPLAQLARLEVDWRPAAIYHRERQRVVSVKSQLAPETTAHEVLAALEPRLETLELPAGVRFELGGETQESGQANAALLRTLPVGVLLLLVFLLIEFNSFRRVAIILVTVPLAVTGVVPGLLLSGEPFGFMSLLGVVSLVGIVVNNAIVLLDVVESHRATGAGVEEALVEAVARRTRPILLTMMTTVAGLLPLALSGSTLWPPLAWAMISGLIASTLLTLLVVPALYRLLFSSWRGLRFGRREAVAAVALLALLAPPTEGAELELTLEEAMEKAAERPLARAAEGRAHAADSAAKAERRAATWPTLGVSAEALRRDQTIEIETPVGDFQLGQRSIETLGVELVQPLLDPARRFYAAPAARARAKAAEERAERTRQELEAEAARAFLQVLALDARREATTAFVASLRARLEETEARVRAGAELEADALKVRLDLESAELELLSLKEARQVALWDLGRAVGLEAPVEPQWDGDFDRSAPVELAELVELAEEHRGDLRALASELRALELARGAVDAERWPRLEARGSWQASSGDAFRPEESAQGSIAIIWAPFAAGTKPPRKAALGAEAEALEADREELLRALKIELRSALAELSTARAAIAVRERGVELAEETLRVERERHGAGRATTNDLLEAEAELRDQKTRRDLARLDVLRAWIRLELVTGTGL